MLPGMATKPHGRREPVRCRPAHFSEWSGRNLVWHAGIIHGFCAAILRYPQDHALVVVLENMEPNLAGAVDPDLDMDLTTIANGLSAIAFGLPADTSPISAKNPDATHKK